MPRRLTKSLWSAADRLGYVGDAGRKKAIRLWTSKARYFLVPACFARIRALIYARATAAENAERRWDDTRDSPRCGVLRLELRRQRSLSAGRGGAGAGARG